MDKDVLALSLLAAGEQAHAFSSFLPSSFTVKSFALDDSDGKVVQKVRDLRSGYKPAVIFGMGLSGIIAFLARSPLPLALSVATSYAMIAAYEGNLPKDMRMDPLMALMKGSATKKTLELPRASWKVRDGDLPLPMARVMM